MEIITLNFGKSMHPLIENFLSAPYITDCWKEAIRAYLEQKGEEATVEYLKTNPQW